MMISCKEAADICNRSQYKEASTWQIIKFKLHLFTCKACSLFTKKNTVLTHLCDKADLRMLEEADKLAMKKALEKELQ